MADASMFSSMKGKSLVIVGASSGIGRAIAVRASDEGALTHLLGRSVERLEPVRAELASPSHVHAVDMLDERAVEAAFERIGAFDYLTLTAVADETKLMAPVRDMSIETARRGMEKFWGTFNVCQAAARRIRPDGAIVVTSSAGALKPSRSGASVMNAASAAVTAFARALALEIAPVRVNVVSPGVVGSGVWSESEREGLESWARSSLPVGRLGTPDDLARAYLALLVNEYMTGSLVSVDGGLLLT